MIWFTIGVLIGIAIGFLIFELVDTGLCNRLIEQNADLKKELFVQRLEKNHSREKQSL